MQECLTIWDRAEAPPSDQEGFLWRGYEDAGNFRSLLRLVDSEGVRPRVLSIANEFSQELFTLTSQKRPLARTDEVFFVMGLLIEKATAKSDAFLDLSRLVAMELALGSDAPRSLTYCGSTRRISEALESFCQRRKISYHWQPPPRRPASPTARGIFGILPHPVRAVIAILRRAWKNFRLRSPGAPLWHGGPDAVCLVSYFFHLDRAACEKNTFFSKYWHSVPELLKHAGHPVNWIHITLKSPEVPDAGTACRLVRAFNEPQNGDRHALIESFIDLRILRDVLVRWIRFLVRFQPSQKEADQMASQLEFGWVWPVLREDWLDSTSGATGIQNWLWIGLFDKAMASLPRQKFGLFLMENQGWERAFIEAWRNHGHGELVGVVHATLRYWDLRYFETPAPQLPAIPGPDRVAINGPAARKLFEESGTLPAKLAEVEAVRFAYLEALDGGHPTPQETTPLRTLLFVGDIIPSATDRILRELQTLAPKLQNHFRIVLKPHPAYRANPDDYPGLKAEWVNNPLNELLPQADVALASVYTSAGLDAYCAGLPVITFLAGDQFNFSPLRGVEGAYFAASTDGLEKALMEALDSPRKPGRTGQFFWLDSNLSRWNELVESLARHRVRPGEACIGC